MAQTIKLKRSSTSGASPTTSQLELGEVAINTYDGKLYIKKDDGTESIVEIGAGGGGSSSTLSSSFTLYEYTATSNQTTFSGSDSNSNTLAYDTGTPPKILVYLNGVLLDYTTDYTATNGTSVVLTTGATAGYVLSIAAYKSDASFSGDFSLNDGVKLNLGTDDDLEVFHNGTDSVINQTGTGDLLIQKDETTVAEFDVDGLTVTGDVEADEFIGDVRGAVLFKAQAGEALAKGDVVYISGISGNTTIVSKADADDASKMPAFGLVAAAASSGNPVDIYTNGILSGIDTSSYSEGDELFVSTTAGALTATAPTGESSALQKIGKVTRSASSGSIFIVGAGRTNAVSNLDDGDIFIGNSSNQAVSASLNTKIESYLDSGVSTPTFAGLATTADVSFGDNDKAIFGAGNDLQIYHDGSNSYVQDLGTGKLILKSNGTATLIQDASGGALTEFHAVNKQVKLFYDNSLKLATTSTGIDVTGNLIVDAGVNGTIDFGNVTAAYGRLYADSTGTFVGSYTNNPLVLRTNNGERMRIDASGNVGIGTNNPQTALHIYDTPAEILRMEGNDEFAYASFYGTVSSTAQRLGYMGFANDTSTAADFNFANNQGGIFSFNAGIDVDGDSSIGAGGNGTHRIGRLTVDYLSNSNPVLSSDGSQINFSDEIALRGVGIRKISTSPSNLNITQDRTGYDIVFNTSPTTNAVNEEVIRFTHDRKVGIGTSSPSYPLTVHNTGDGIKFEISDLVDANYRIQVSGNDIITGPSTSSDYLFQTGNTERMRITSSGNVGIGTSSVSRGPLEIHRPSTADCQIHLTNTSTGTGGNNGTTIFANINAGIWHRENGYFRIATNNTERMRITSVGSIQIPNQDAINELEFTGTEYTNIYSATTSGMDVGTTGSGYLRLLTNNTERMRIDSAGNVGIGADNPSAKLQIESSGGYSVFSSGRSVNGIDIRGAAGGSGNFAGGISFGVGATGRAAIAGLQGGADADLVGLSFFIHNSSGGATDAAEAMRITSAGDVEIKSGGELIANRADNARNIKLFNDNSFGTIQTSIDPIKIASQSYTRFDVSGTERMRINSSGNVGIGTSSPSSRVHASGDAYTAFIADGTSGGAFKFYKNGSQHAQIFSDGSGDLVFRNNTDSERMRIDSSGNLLVGKTSNGSSLVGFETAGDGTCAITRDGGQPLLLNRLTNDGDIAIFRKDGTTVGSIATLGGALQISGGSLSGLQFSSQVRPMANGSATDGATDFGRSANRWRNIYATNGTIQTSDRNEKQDIEELSDAEQRVAVACKGLLRKFRWIDSVEEKGDDARIHFGIIAQDLQDAFTAEGLDAGRYGMFINSTWTDEETGEERSRMGVRYSELLAFIISAI